MNVYEIVTDKILSEMKKGVVPWKQGWVGGRAAPISYSTGKPYSILNQMLLGKPGEYLTFKQCETAGGHIKKGEKGNLIVFWKIMNVPVRDEKSGKDSDKSKIIPCLKYYYVFHVDQCDGIKSKWNRKAAPITPAESDEKADSLIKEYVSREKLDFRREEQGQAYYIPKLDRVITPIREQFKTQAEYYGTTFHELIHSKGHPSRLMRFEDTSKCAAFGSEDYSKEELIAEIGSAFLNSSCEIETDESLNNSASYIDNWSKVIGGDPRLVVSAAGKAEKAAKYIMEGKS